MYNNCQNVQHLATLLLVWNHSVDKNQFALEMARQRSVSNNQVTLEVSTTTQLAGLRQGSSQSAALFKTTSLSWVRKYEKLTVFAAILSSTCTQMLLHCKVKNNVINVQLKLRQFCKVVTCNYAKLSVPKSDLEKCHNLTSLKSKCCWARV